MAVVIVDSEVMKRGNFVKKKASIYFTLFRKRFNFILLACLYLSLFGYYVCQTFVSKIMAM